MIVQSAKENTTLAYQSTIQHDQTSSRKPLLFKPILAISTKTSLHAPNLALLPLLVKQMMVLALDLALPHRRDARIKRTAPDLCVPGPGPAVAEHFLNLLEALLGSLWVRDKSLDGSAKTQGAEDHERLPGDVAEGRGHEEAEGEVEDPVGQAGDAHAVGAGFERPDLGGVDPGDGGEGQGVDDDEQVGEGDDGARGAAWAERDDDVGVPVYAFGDVVAVVAKDAADDEVTHAHADGTVDEERTSTGVVDEEEREAAEYDEERILDAARYEVDIACETSHCKYIHHIVHHDIGAARQVSLVNGQCKDTVSEWGSYESCCHACTLAPANVRLHIPFAVNFLHPLAPNRSAVRTVMISSHSAITSGSLISPPACMLARTWIASSFRPTLASHRGLLGKKGMPTRRSTAGTN